MADQNPRTKPDTSSNSHRALVVKGVLIVQRMDFQFGFDVPVIHICIPFWLTILNLPTIHFGS